MFGSLRFRLPALFLLGIVLAGLVASLIAIRFFQSYTRTHAVDELRAESVGIVRLYARQAGAATINVPSLESAIGGERSTSSPRSAARSCFSRCRLFRRTPSISPSSRSAA